MVNHPFAEDNLLTLVNHPLVATGTWVTGLVVAYLPFAPILVGCTKLIVELISHQCRSK